MSPRCCAGALVRDLGGSSRRASAQEPTWEIDDGAIVGGATAPESPIRSNSQSVHSAWSSAAQRGTRDDWHEWLRRLCLEMLRESPSAALRACATPAQTYPPLAQARAPRRMAAAIPSRSRRDPIRAKPSVERSWPGAVQRGLLLVLVRARRRGSAPSVARRVARVGARLGAHLTRGDPPNAIENGGHPGALSGQLGMWIRCSKHCSTSPSSWTSPTGRCP